MPDDRKTYTIRGDEGIGSVKIADEVVAVIAGLAATEVKGVAALSGGITAGLVAKKGIKALSRGVKVEVKGNEIAIDLTLELDYGYSIPEIGSQVQQKVKSAIENMTGMTVTDINVTVADVAAE